MHDSESYFALCGEIQKWKIQTSPQTAQLKMALQIVYTKRMMTEPRLLKGAVSTRTELHVQRYV